MRNHSRVGSIRTLLEESNTVPSYDGSLGHAPQGLNPKQALALNDLMNHGISGALLQLFPSARCTLPPGSTTRNTTQVLSLPHRPSGEPGTPQPF